MDQTGKKGLDKYENQDSKLVAKKSLKNIEGQCPEKKRSKFKINRAKIDFIKKT